MLAEAAVSSEVPGPLARWLTKFSSFGCRTKGFSFLLAVSHRPPSAPRGHLRFLPTWGSLTWPSCSSKLAREEENLENRCDRLVYLNHTHFITYAPPPLMCAIGWKQVIRPTKFSKGSTQGHEHQKWILWRPLTKNLSATAYKHCLWTYIMYFLGKYMFWAINAFNFNSLICYWNINDIDYISKVMLPPIQLWVPFFYAIKNAIALDFSFIILYKLSAV